MELLHSTRLHFETMGIRECDSFNWRNLIFLVTLLESAILTGAFLVLSKAKNEAENAFALFQITCAVAASSAILVCIWRKRNLFEMMHSFALFIGKRSQRLTSKIKYAELTEKIERMSKLFHIILIRILCTIANVTPLVISMTNYFVLNLGDESFLMQGPTILPFKWAPPFGYIVVWLDHALKIFCVMFLVVPLISAGIGSCWLVISFIKDIQNDLVKYHRSIKKLNKNVGESRVRFCNIVQLYSEAKEFVSKVNEICEFLILDLFAFTLLSISTSLFATVSQLSHENANRAELIQPAMSILLSLSIIFCECEFGQQLTQQFDAFDKSVRKLKWYLLPLELQRMLVIVILNTQQPAYFHGYGNIQCTRESFKQTVHTAFSYFMTLRRLNG